MENSGGLSFPFLPTRLEHVLVAALALAGCHTEPKRLDEVAISKFVPGQTNFTDVQTVLGLPDGFEIWPFPETSKVRYVARWGPEYFDWDFFLEEDGTLVQFGRRVYTWTLFSPPGERPMTPKELGLLYEPPLPVAAACAEHFQPGTTTQAEVVAAWGPCEGAGARPSGHYTMHWGSHSDSWSLEFDSSGVLADTPQHYVSRTHGK
jgi:hypothetical protein